MHRPTARTSPPPLDGPSSPCSRIDAPRFSWQNGDYAVWPRGEPDSTISPIHTPESIVAEQAARAGGDVLDRCFNQRVEARSKDIANLVADADLDAERTIAAVIRAAFPSHEVLGEAAHAGDITAEHLWIVDPLDGKNNFAHQVPHFAVSVASYRSSRAECGIVFNPAR